MIIERNNVFDSGETDRRPIVFVHGFGCDQSMWRDITPAFSDKFRIVCYDLTGMGQSDLSAYDSKKYGSLDGHAYDLIEILTHLNLDECMIVGHSVGATIALIASNRVLERISNLVLVSPTPSFLDDPDSGYSGGFSKSQIEELIQFLDENHFGWSHQMAPIIAGQPPEGEAADRLTQSFCKTDPRISSHFARVTFLEDHRRDMTQAACPSLVLHCDDDTLVPMHVAEWMRENIPNSTLKVLGASGHCPHMTVPQLVIDAIQTELA